MSSDLIHDRISRRPGTIYMTVRQTTGDRIDTFSALRIFRQGILSKTCTKLLACRPYPPNTCIGTTIIPCICISNPNVFIWVAGLKMHQTELYLYGNQKEQAPPPFRNGQVQERPLLLYPCNNVIPQWRIVIWTIRPVFASVEQVGPQIMPFHWQRATQLQPVINKISPLFDASCSIPQNFTIIFI